MRETTVETHLHRQVVKAGGDTRKYGRRKADPDRIVFWPRYTRRSDPLMLKPTGVDIDLVETKAPGKKPRADQVREHTRLRALGCRVLVIDTKEKVDAYVKGVHRR